MSQGLFDRMPPLLPGLAREMVEVFRGEVPFYRRLPAEQLGGEIRSLCEDSVRALVDAVAGGGLPSQLELDANRASAARRAQEGVPLDAVLAAYQVGGRLTWRALVAEAGPGETAELLAAADLVQQYVQLLTGAVTSAYLEEHQLRAGEERDARRDLARELLEGDVRAASAARAGVDVDGTWTVAALSLGEHPDERQRGTDRLIAGRRKVRRLQRALDLIGPVLTLLEPSGGLVLSRVELPAIADLTRACGVRVRLAQVTTQAPDVPAARALVEQLLAVGAALGLDAVTVPDVACALQLTRPSAARDHLAGLLAPLAGRPDLLETVATYLEQDHDRRRTALALHVHPNTLDHRLRRITVLTGLDLGTTKGLVDAAAALVVRRVCG